MFGFLRGLAALALGLFGWGVEQCAGFLTRRNYAQERADARQLEADACQTQAHNDVVEARHTETTSLVQDQIAETRKLRRAIERVAQPVERPKSIAERKREIAEQSASHDPVIRSSQWLQDDEVDNVVVLKVA